MQLPDCKPYLEDVLVGHDNLVYFRLFPAKQTSFFGWVTRWGISTFRSDTGETSKDEATKESALERETSSFVFVT